MDRSFFYRLFEEDEEWFCVLQKKSGNEKRPFSNTKQYIQPTWKKLKHFDKSKESPYRFLFFARQKKCPEETVMPFSPLLYQKNRKILFLNTKVRAFYLNI